MYNNRKYSWEVNFVEEDINYVEGWVCKESICRHSGVNSLISDKIGNPDYRFYPSKLELQLKLDSMDISDMYFHRDCLGYSSDPEYGKFFAGKQRSAKISEEDKEDINGLIRDVLVGYPTFMYWDDRHRSHRRVWINFKRVIRYEFEGKTRELWNPRYHRWFFVDGTELKFREDWCYLFEGDLVSFRDKRLGVLLK